MKTVTFETAKRLYDLGVRFYRNDHYYKIESRSIYHELEMLRCDIPIDERFIPAPDAQELLDRMPKRIIIGVNAYVLVIKYSSGIAIPDYLHDGVGECLYDDEYLYESELLQERLAELTEWLIENKYTTVEQINKGE